MLTANGSHRSLRDDMLLPPAQCDRYGEVCRPLARDLTPVLLRELRPDWREPSSYPDCLQGSSRQKLRWEFQDAGSHRDDFADRHRNTEPKKVILPAELDLAVCLATYRRSRPPRRQANRWRERRCGPGTQANRCGARAVR